MGQNEVRKRKENNFATKQQVSCFNCTKQTESNIFFHRAAALVQV